MKRALTTLLLCLAALGARAQNDETSTRADERGFSFATTVGAGFCIDKPSSVPFSWQVLAYYHSSRRWAFGAGTGLSCYEKVLLPLYGDVKYQIGRRRKFTPHVELAAGYAFVLSGTADGGLFLNPSVGVQYRLRSRLKLQLAVGFELQKLERLKTQTDGFFHKTFEEKLAHNTISVRFGVCF